MKKRTHILIILTLIITVLLMACDKSETIICGNCSATSPNGSQYCSSCGMAFFQNNASTSTEFTGESTEDTPTTNTSTENPQPTVGDNSESTETTAAQPTTSTSEHTHKYSAATCTSPKSCSCGVTSGSALGHNWKSATCTSPKKCSRCGTTSGKAASHNYSTKVTAPTCTAKGYTTYTCSACGDTYKGNYKDASHKYKDYKCTSCGTVDKAHAYEYLVAWVKQKGTANGSYVSIVYEQESGLKYELKYSAQDDCLFATLVHTVSQSYTAVTALQLDSYYYGHTFLQNEVCGFIDAETFNSNSAMTYTKYTGIESQRIDMLNTARNSLTVILCGLEQYFITNKVGIYIADLGFKGI